MPQLRKLRRVVMLAFSRDKADGPLVPARRLLH